MVSTREPVDVEGLFLDLQTLSPPGRETRRQKLDSGQPPKFVAASADGSRFGVYGQFGTYRVAEVSGAPQSLGSIPSPSLRAVILNTTGSRYFTSSGIFASDGRPIEEPRRDKGAMFVPAYFGAAVAGILPVETRLGEYDVSKIEIYDGTEDWHILSTYEAPRELRELRQRLLEPHTLQLQQRVHLYPSADLLVTLGASDDEVTFRRIGIRKALEKSDRDFLFVNSLPRPSAERGKVWAYEPKVQAKAHGVKITLDVAPPGMRQSKPGRIEWQVPSDQSEAERVVLRFTGSAGLDQFQSFIIRVNAPPP
jgi:hypothetical protein